MIDEKKEPAIAASTVITYLPTTLEKLHEGVKENIEECFRRAYNC